jgi:hypothetical protein
MNSTQRKYLVDKIQSTLKTQIRELENSIPKRLTFNIELLSLVMQGKFEIQPIEKLKASVIKRAMDSSQNDRLTDDWLGNQWGRATKGEVVFTLADFFVIPQEFLERQNARDREIREIEEQIRQLRIKSSTLEVRIMVASDSKLKQLINDVDDLGDIKLVDTHIKSLD